jgi:hypothetical protein
VNVCLCARECAGFALLSKRKRAREHAFVRLSHSLAAACRPTTFHRGFLRSCCGREASDNAAAATHARVPCVFVCVCACVRVWFRFAEHRGLFDSREAVYQYVMDKFPSLPEALARFSSEYLPILKASDC